MTSPTPERPSARRILELAAKVEAAEADIKAAILAAARAGDCGTVVAIMERWNSMPTGEVLAGLSLQHDPDLR